MKILIVDDEVPIRKYITQMIRECGTDYEIIGSVSSAKVALEIIKTQMPDLVFADITMPKMNGLELLEIIKTENPETDVFMLTCHNDFEFARTAMKLQADNYILKDEINSSYMENLLKAVREKREAAIKPSLYRLQSNSYFIHLMDSEDTLLFDSYDLEKHKIFLKDKEFIVIQVTNCHKNLQKIISFKFPVLQNQEVFPYQDFNIILVANIEGAQREKMHRDIREIVQKLREEVRGPIGISSVHYKIHMLKQAVQEAGASYSCEYYEKPVCNLAAKDNENNNSNKAEIQRYVGRAHSLMAEGKYKKLFELILEMVAFSAEQNVDVYFLKKALSVIIGDYEAQSGIKANLNQMTDTKNVTQLQEYLKGLIKHFIPNSVQYSQAVSDAIHYMEQHFGENITLPKVAETVHLNSEYFSRRFKKETGLNFSEYLLQMRMEEARNLLVSTKKSITEIAGETGFNNDSYFSATFKKVFGENPNEVRKNK